MIVSVLVAKRARVRLGEMVLLFAFAISLRTSPEGKSISYQVWTECQDHVPQILGGLKRSRILLRINLQDLMPLRAFHADQQWPLDLGHEKKIQQLCVPFQAYCITAVGNCNCGLWLC